MRVSLAQSLEILFEDNHCLALNKPAGWPTTHFAGEETVDRLVKTYLKEKYKKPGQVFVGVVHRLDKPATGVLLFARTSKAAARLAEQFRNTAVEKVYWAVVQRGKPGPRSAARTLPRPERAVSLPPAGSFDDWLHKDESIERVVIATQQTAGAKHTLTHYQVRARHNDMTLLELRPQTGRKHQLRVQLSSRGFPIYGDVKYGSMHSLGPAIALHARSLTFLHPIRQEPITLTAELPKFWRGPFAHLLKEAAA